MLDKQDIAGAKLTDKEKETANAKYSKVDVLNKETGLKLVNGTVSNKDGTHTYLVATVKNEKYNNKNRVDASVKFPNTEAIRHRVMRAYYYVWNISTGKFEITAPVYFYFYDIGNSVSNTNAGTATPDSP